MRALIVAAIAAVVLAVAPSTGRADVACRVAGGCAQGCACGDQACSEAQCGGGGGDGGGYSYELSPEEIAAEMARREEAFQASLAEAQARGAAVAVESVKRANDRARAAAKKHQWRRAIAELEAALLLDPTSTITAQNLDYARAQEQLELRQREVAVGPTMPAAVTPVVIADRIPTELTPARPESRTYLERTFDYFAGQATEAAGDQAIRWIDVTTPWGLYLRVQANVAQLANEVPGWITKAASGEMTLEEARTLPLKAASMIFNVGSAPGEYAHRMVEVRSGTVAALEETERRVTRLVERGITSIAARTGVPRDLAARALATGKAYSETVLRWIKPR